MTTPNKFRHRIQSCVDEATFDAIWKRCQEQQISISTLVRQYILKGLSENPR